MIKVAHGDLSSEKHTRFFLLVLEASMDLMTTAEVMSFNTGQHPHLSCTPLLKGKEGR
jgi:hypothetical protein